MPSNYKNINTGKRPLSKPTVSQKLRALKEGLRKLKQQSQAQPPSPSNQQPINRRNGHHPSSQPPELMN
jgi:hypothetical protein